jgi:hypothetical protein
MKIESFVICDAASDYGGKLCILGAFDSFVISNFPYTHPLCSIAIRIRYLQSEQGEHDFHLLIISNDQTEKMAELKGRIKVEISKDVKSGVINLISILQALQIKNAGEYSIVLRMDGSEIGAIPLNIFNQMPVDVSSNSQSSK